jgi:hypothetical protein
MPEAANDLSVFKAGLYTALYSPDPDYMDESGRAAGAALQKAIWNVSGGRYSVHRYVDYSII